MKLTNVFLNNINVNTEMGTDAGMKQSKGAGKASFESFMAQKQNDVGLKKLEAHKKDDAPKGKDDNLETHKEKAKPLVSTKVSGKKPDNNKKASKEDVDAANDEIVEDISEELDIPKEAIAEILAQLNMTPLDLTSADKLTSFLQAAYKVSSPAELLNVPNISQVLTNLNNMLAQYTDMSEMLQTANVETGVATAAMPLASDAQAAPEEVTPQGKATSVLSSPAEQDTGVLQLKEADTEATAETGDQPNEVQEGTLFANVGAKQDGTKQSFGQHENTNSNEQTLINPINTQTVTTIDTKAAAFKAEVAKPVNTQDVVEQMVENLKVNVKEGVSEIRIVLKPEQLGDITLKVLTENGIITAKFVAESQRVKEIIEANFNHLKETLQQQGIAVSELSVSVGQDDSDRNMQQFLRERQKSSARVRQIINSISEEQGESDETSSKAKHVEDINVDFTA